MRTAVCWHDADVKGCTYPNCVFRHPSREKRGSRERSQHLKRRNSNCFDSQSHSRSQSHFKKVKADLLENGQYRVKDIPSSMALHSGKLAVSEGDIVRFSNHCNQHSRCHFVLVKDIFNEVGYIEEERIGEFLAFHCSLFLDCQESFQTEVDLETHLCKEHFYQTLEKSVLKHSAKSRRFRCPRRDCEEKFEELSEAILHYGVREHRAVVSLLYAQSGLGLTTNLKLLQLKQKEAEVKKELSDLGKSIVEIDKLKAENKGKESEILVLREELKEIIDWKDEARKKEGEYFLEIQKAKALVEEKSAELEECRLQVEKQKDDLTLRESELLQVTSNSQELRTKLEGIEEKVIELETLLQEQKQSLENKSSELNQYKNEVSDLKEQVREKDLKKKRFIEHIESIKERFNHL